MNYVELKVHRFRISAWEPISSPEFFALVAQKAASADSNGFDISIKNGLLAGTGAGGLLKQGEGSLTLLGSSTYIGDTEVEEGSLIVTGAVPGLINVSAGATLGGSGVAGFAAIADAAILAPGDDLGNHLTIDDLALSSGSILQFDLGAPLANPASTTPDVSSDHVDIVMGNLALSGSLQINPLSGFGAPVAGNRWLLMSYAWSLDDQTLSVDLAHSPALASGLSYVIQTNTPGYVYLAIVPEAGSASLLLLGLALLRRRLR